MEHSEVKKHLVIQADASTQIGTGHLMRCVGTGVGLKTDLTSEYAVRRNSNLEYGTLIAGRPFGVGQDL